MASPIVKREEYQDEREDLPVRLRRTVVDYTITIEEQRLRDNVLSAGEEKPTGHFVWSMFKEPNRPGQLCASGTAPSIDAALEVIDRILLAYGIKNRVALSHDRMTPLA